MNGEGFAFLLGIACGIRTCAIVAAFLRLQICRALTSGAPSSARRGCREPV